MARGLPFLLFGAVTLAIFFPVLFQEKTIYPVDVIKKQRGIAREQPPDWLRPDRPHARVADAVVLLPPLFQVYNEGLKQGELRLWNPTLFCGTPLYADTMVHPFYPPQIVLHALFSPLLAYHMSLMLHLFFAGAAMYALLRQLERSSPASTAGGLAWMLLGYNSLWFSTGILLGAAVFGPLALLALLRSLARKNLSLAALSGAAMGTAFLGSHPQHALLMFLFVGAWAALEGLRSRELRPFAIRGGLLFALFTVGTGLAAILTRLDSIENGYRDPTYDSRTLYEKPWELATHLSGLVVGKVYFPESLWTEYEFTAYVGLAVFSLALLGAVRKWTDPRARFLAIFAGAALLGAFLLPLAGLLSRIPHLNLSPPSRWIFPAGFAIVVLAAEGLDAFLERPGRAPRLVGAFAALFGVACLIEIGPFRFSNGAAAETAIGFALVATAFFSPGRVRFAVGVAAILVELLLPFVRYHNWPARDTVMRDVPEVVRIARDREKEPWRGTGLLGATVTDEAEGYLSEFVDGNNVLAVYGVENSAGFDAIVPGPYARFALTVRGGLNPMGRSITFVDVGSPLLDLTNTRYLFFPPRLRPHPRYRKIHEEAKVALYENPNALPRAWLVGRVIPAVDLLDADRKLRNPSFDPRKEVIVEGRDLPSTGGTGTVTWIERTPDRLVLETRAEGDAMLVLSETHHPGWTAEIDGTPGTVYRANVAFRAVAVPAGTHRVTLRFQPESAARGLSGSAVFAALALLLWALGRRRA
jgi:hypothetical protein